MTVVPDPERVIYEFLTAHTDIEPLETRIVGRTPSQTTVKQGGKDKVMPWVRVTLLDERNITGAPVEEVVSALLQLDIYAGSQADVLLHARTIRAALFDDLPGSTVADALVYEVVTVGMARIPDSDFEPARERVMLTIDARMRPTWPGS